jgi:hypothetical protein
MNTHKFRFSKVKGSMLTSWLKAIGSLTVVAMRQASISGGKFSGGWLSCGGAFYMLSKLGLRRREIVEAK